MPTESHKLVLLENISRIAVSSRDLEETLDHSTALIKVRLRVEMCSIYLFDDCRLVLRSSRGTSKGLATSAVGPVTMDPHEGIPGLTFETGRSVNVQDAASPPRFKFFPGSGEETFRSYLG